MNSKKDALEISSTQIHTDLKEIKERISALETIASLANRATVEAYARTVLTSAAVKAIVAACRTPKTKEELRTELGYQNIQALDYHLNQVRQHDLLQPETNENGILTFRWSNLFARLPKATLDVLLGTPKANKVVNKAAKAFHNAESS
jgi:hypothetical protein